MPGPQAPRPEQARPSRPSSEPASSPTRRVAGPGTSRQPVVKTAPPGHTVDEPRPSRHAVMREERPLRGYSSLMSCHAFVLGGGGLLGAAEAGMASALLDAGVRPDVVCGTSVGAINGAALAADPTPAGVQHLLAFWEALPNDGALDGSVVRRVAEVMRHRTSLHGNGELRRMLREHLAAATFEELAVPFECVAASIEQAREHWFHTGELIEP